MTNVLWMIVDAVGSLLGSLCLLRAYAGWVRLNPRDQFFQFSMALTDWLVKPMRKLVPGSKGVDWASILAAFVIAALVGLAGASMAEMPDVGKNHRDIDSIGHSDDICVSFAPAGLYDRGNTGICGHFHTVRERKKRVGRQHRARCFRAG